MSGSEAPQVSVLIGAYNNAATLARAVGSMLAQTLRALEVIVIDDGSSDGSAAIAHAAAEQDRRVRVLVMESNLGISRSLNVGLQAARASVVAIQDADDFSAPDRLARQLAALEADEAIAVVGCRMREIDEAGRELVPRTSFCAGEVGEVLMRFNPIPNGCAMLRRDAVLAMGGYDPRYRYAMEYDLWLRLAERWRLVALPEILATRVMGTGNVAARAERAQIRETLVLRWRALARRRSLRGALGMVPGALSYLTPLWLKRQRRRLLGQAP